MFALSSSFAKDELERVEDRDPFLDRGDHFGAIDDHDI
jgi:putative hemolysin